MKAHDHSNTDGEKLENLIDMNLERGGEEAVVFDAEADLDFDFVLEDEDLSEEIE